MWVVFFHLKLYLFPEHNEIWLKPIQRGYLLVDLFFVLSGFLMAYLYGSFFENTLNKKAIGTFLKARIARIYPLHFFTFLLLFSWYCFNVFILGKPREYGRIYEESAVLSQLFLVQAWGIHSGNTWNIPAWSISTEWAAYLVFPFWWRFWSKMGVRGAFFFLPMALLGYFILEIFHTKQNLDITFDWALLRCFLGFGCGMALFVITPTIVTFFEKQSLLKALNSLTLLVVTCLVMVFSSNDTSVVALWPIWVFYSFWKSDLYPAGLQKTLHFLGNISFSLYLIHLPLLYLVPQALNMGDPINLPEYTRLSISFVFLVTTLALSQLTYHKIEQPMRSWLRKKLGLSAAPSFT